MAEFVIHNEDFQEFLERYEEKQIHEAWVLKLREKLLKMGIDCPPVESRRTTSGKIGSGDRWGRLVL